MTNIEVVDGGGKPPRKKKMKRPPLTKEERKRRRDHKKYLGDTTRQDENHRKFFAKPAVTCGLCGYPMDYNGHKLTEWEAKWSIHEPCREKAHKMLDRDTGITRERRQR